MRLIDSLADQLDFVFLDGANLQEPQKSRQQAFSIRFVAADAFERSETCVLNGAKPEEIAAAKTDAPVMCKRIRAQ